MLVGPCRGLPKKGQEFLRPHVVWSVETVDLDSGDDELIPETNHPKP